MHILTVIEFKVKMYGGAKTDESVEKEVVLSETTDKYDLELYFRPKHRSKIQNSKNNPTFFRWDQQMINTDFIHSVT